MSTSATSQQGGDMIGASLRFSLKITSLDIFTLPDEGSNVIVGVTAKYVKMGDIRFSSVPSLLLLRPPPKIEFQELMNGACFLLTQELYDCIAQRLHFVPGYNAFISFGFKQGNQLLNVRAYFGLLLQEPYKAISGEVITERKEVERSIKRRNRHWST
ncbi:hypothetical protein OUZ56_010445 [Daphnia magna]|uniref:Uncharacterized protein n=1 Tax=Daphnia magna TaxID=35525 RepID=A0ABR0AIL1_9CRUS|nr:hypothetical protein OUZ56_010445 [Daphnia magna]